MVELAKTSDPVQGEFYFGKYNGHKFWNQNKPLVTKEGVRNCGSVGCLAGGTLPKINPERFHFNENGGFFDYDSRFDEGLLKQELGYVLFDALFAPLCQEELKLKQLYADSTKQAVIENAEAVLKIIEKLVDLGHLAVELENAVAECGDPERYREQFSRLKMQYIEASNGVLALPKLNFE